MRQQVVDGDGEEVVGIEQAKRRRDDAVTVDVGVVAPGDGEAVLQPDQPGHGEGARAVHADLAVVVERHEGKGRIDAGIDDLDVEPVALGDRLPVGDGGAAERIDADFQSGAADRRHVDHLFEVGDVGRDEVLGDEMRRRQRGRVVQSLHRAVAVGHQRVGALFDPAGDVGVGRAAIGRVVLDAAVARRVVRGRDDNAVGGVAGVLAVVFEDGARDHRRRRIAVVGLIARQHAVGGEHRQRRALRRRRQRVRVLAEKERSGNALQGAVFTDRLRDGEDVRLVETAGQRAAAVAAGAEGDALRRVIAVRRVGVGREQCGNVGEKVGGSRLAGERVGHRGRPDKGEIDS